MDKNKNWLFLIAVLFVIGLASSEVTYGVVCGLSGGGSMCDFVRRGGLILGLFGENDKNNGQPVGGRDAFGFKQKQKVCPPGYTLNSNDQCVNCGVVVEESPKKKNGLGVGFSAVCAPARCGSRTGGCATCFTGGGGIALCERCSYVDLSDRCPDGSKPVAPRC